MPREKKDGSQEAKKRERTKPEDTYSIWENPLLLFDSGYGRIMYKNWCKHEIDYLAKRGKFVEILTAPDGDIALAEIKEKQE